jgi:hypothetical protein
MKSDDVAEVYCARDSATAHRIVAMLAAHGIPARVVNEDLDGVVGGMNFLGFFLPRVWVPRSLAERATSLIEEMEQPGKADESAWSCPSCGADVDSGFDVCWNCGRPRP